MEDSIIKKKTTLPGVDMSIFDFSDLTSVKIQRTFISKPIHKVGAKTYIGLKESADEGDILELGNLGIKYVVLSLKQLTPREGKIHRIKRLDGNSTTSTDIAATKVGQKVRILNRRSFNEIFNNYPHNTINPDFDELSGICPDDKCKNKNQI